MAARMRIKLKNFSMLGDGECNEGSVWRQLCVPPHYKLNNLVAIVDEIPCKMMAKAKMFFSLIQLRTLKSLVGMLNQLMATI